MREFINGAEVIARAALQAGCDFFAGYPITPATPILLHMIDELPKVGGVAIQAEDEIASLGMCIGAVLTGRRAMTATSGPGISLYSENIGAAIMLETPLVIIDVQRMGPATGGATTGEQGDIQFLRWGTAGGYPMIVLSPCDLPSCYRLTQQAFDLAERFRMPVFLATEKELVLNTASVDSASFEDIPVRQRPLAPVGEKYIPYQFDLPEQVKAMSPFGGPHLLRVTTSSHNPEGYLTKDPAAMEQVNRHLAAKIEAHRDEISLIEADIQPGASTVIIAYGVSAGAAGEAVNLARRKGEKISLLKLYSIWPVPEKAIRAVIDGANRVVVVEMNLGLYRREIECLARQGQEVVGVNRLDGKLISPDEILSEVRGG